MCYAGRMENAQENQPVPASANINTKPHLGFWANLRVRAQVEKRPIVVLAPMADVTDVSFRTIIAKYSRMGQKGGGPDVLWTEFVSADGLAFAPAEGRAKLERDLEYGAGEHPIVAQFFTSNPVPMEKAAALARERGFDGVDINMGCPDKSIERQGAGAAMIKNPAKAQEVIRAAIRGAQGVPVSVKTRIGFNKNELDTWLPAILETCPAVVTVHARTRKEMSLVPARWEHVAEAVKIRDRVQAHLAPHERTLIFGNGDVMTLEDAAARAQATGADGVMLGRAIFGNPWLFDAASPMRGFLLSVHEQTDRALINERLRVLVEHSLLYEQKLGDLKSFAIMKKHFKAYVANWHGAKELRNRLMEAQKAQEVKDIVDEVLSS